MKKISKDRLSLLWDSVSKEQQLYLPTKKGDSLDFNLWDGGNQVELEELRTNLSPKSLLFPQNETYLKFEKKGRKLNLETVGVSEDRYVVFGVRSCDVGSFKLLDNIFLREPVDTYYREHRDKGTIISLACNDPEETCFCSSFDIDASKSQEGADISVWDTGETLLWNVTSSKGSLFMDKFCEHFDDLAREDLGLLKKLKKHIKSETDSLPFVNIKPNSIELSQQELFSKEDIWDDLSKRCLACGTCSYTCPTCHCYDVKDYKNGEKGEKYRCWDSCMSSDFTLMAHGNPRTTQLQRVRQRFMHKLVYYPKNHEGHYSCVGCGRCVEKCPVNLDIIKVIKKLGGVKNEL